MLLRRQYVSAKIASQLKILTGFADSRQYLPLGVNTLAWQRERARESFRLVRRIGITR